jgi:multidrug efflux pump subunit AcrA (membrane-fusion protein)
MRDKLIACLLIIVALIVAGITGTLTNLTPWSNRSATHQANLLENNATQETLRVQTVRPRTDTNYSITVSQPAEVQPYYSIDLYAETAGTILRIESEVGDEIDRGQTVAEIRPIGTQSVELIESPIDGIVVSRSVDPGTFVPNAAVLPGARPLVSIAKTDVVTVCMNVPDMFAPFVKPGMPARIKNPNATKNQWIDTKLTRVSPVANPADRTLGVQIDLFNQTRAEFDELIADSQASGYEDFKSRQPPEFPTNFSETQEARLTPGLIHEMQITINDLGQLPLLPSECIVNRSGKSFVFLIEENQLVQVPVSVHFNDGKYCYVKPIRAEGKLQTPNDWTGQEVVVLASQFDLQSGKAAVSEN